MISCSVKFRTQIILSWGIEGNKLHYMQKKNIVLESEVRINMLYKQTTDRKEGRAVGWSVEMQAIFSVYRLWNSLEHST